MEFQRFISYIYGYRNNEKQQNCGFVKVEVRQNMARFIVHIYLPGKRETEYKIYGFVRKEQTLAGILLGMGTAKNGNLDVRIHMNAEKLGIEERKAGEEEISVEQLAGLIITGSDRSVYGTVWDEGELQVSQFVEHVDNEKTENVLHAEELDSNPVSDDTGSEHNNINYRTEILDWDMIQKNCPELKPFEIPRDGRYFRIEPKDLKYFSRKFWYLGSNSFLLHGYYNYRYFIVGKEKNGILLGIPGNYFPKEENVATMFGFPAFLPAGRQDKENGRFGYWCRYLIDD